MFSINILKQEIKILNEKIKTLAMISYTEDSYATLEIDDIKMLIKDLEESIAFLKERHLIK